MNQETRQGELEEIPEEVAERLILRFREAALEDYTNKEENKGMVLTYLQLLFGCAITNLNYKEFMKIEHLLLEFLASREEVET